MSWFIKTVQVPIGVVIILIVVVGLLAAFFSQDIAIGVQTVATVFIALTLGVYWLQFRTMQLQLNTMKDSARGQNILALVNFLQEKSVVDARRTDIEALPNMKMSEWIKNDDYKEKASTVCSTYDVVGIFIREQLVPPEPFVDDWGPSIVNCYETLEDFVKHMQESKAGPDYWNDFKVLYQCAKHRHPLVGRKVTESEA